jgi:Flp pilus assembly protein TadG
VTFEALLVLPILLAVVLGLVEFAMLLTAEQKLAEASGLAARAGATGRSDEDVKQAVKTVLGDKQYAHAKVHMNRWEDRHTGPMIEVQVQLPAKVASTNVLRSVGLDLSGETLTGRTVMRVE